MITPNREHIFALAFSVLCCNATHAYYPFITDDTGTQGLGGHQLEFAYERSKDRRDVLDGRGNTVGRETSISTTLPMTYTYGITETADIFLGVTRQVSLISGWQNTELGVKWSPVGNQKEEWSFGIKPSVIFPVNERSKDRGLGNAKINWSVNAIATYLNEDYEMHLNMGYTSNRDSARQDEAARRSLWNASVASVIVLNDYWKIGAEAGLKTNADYASKAVAFGGMGAVYTPIKNMQIGAGLHTFPAINARDNSRKHAATLGLTTQF